MCLRTLTGHDYLVRALSFDPRSGRLVSGSYDKTVKVWDLHAGRMLREFHGCHGSHIFDVKFDQCRIVRWVCATRAPASGVDEVLTGLFPLQHIARPENRGARLLGRSGHDTLRMKPHSCAAIVLRSGYYTHAIMDIATLPS